MKKKITYFLLPVFMMIFQSCGIYSFTGADTGGASTFQVNFFENTADIIEPGLDRAFTVALQDLIQNQTNLSLVNSGGDLLYEGEIVDYYEAPMTATADNRAAQNRLTITVMVRFYNSIQPANDFEQRFSFYYDFPAAAPLTGGLKETALDEIFTRITQDIFNASLTNW
ncbi:MAG TPA: LptE family protein [Gillisia sp.]|nr:LptE family protein [Gillisia sp.]